MGMDTPDELAPPSAARVAKRAIALIAVVCRGMLDLDRDRREAEARRLHLSAWLERVGAADELEERENALIATVHGLLDEQNFLDSVWRSEGMLVLAWSLGRTDLLSYDTQCDSSAVVAKLGFLAERCETVLAAPMLRERAEIEHWANTYLTLHWRLRQYRLNPEPIDFAAYAAACKWGPLTVAELSLIDDDLAIRGERIDRVDDDTRDRAYSAVQERHQAFNWLLGQTPVYSEVSTDT
jgi:hypothetical protein